MKRFSVSARRIMALMLAGMIMLTGMAGCKSKNADTEAGKYPESTGVSKEVTYPIVSDGSITFKYWMPLSSSAVKFIDSYASNTAYQQVQKDTGIKINFIHPAVGSAKEQFNLLIASGDLPDMIQKGSYYTGGVYQGFANGAYQDLTPYLKDNAPDYLKVINTNEAVRRQAYTENKVIAFHLVSLEPNPPFYRPVLRGDWLKEFGMKTPTTLDEYEAYFKAILEKKPGVTPFTTSPSTSVNDRDIWMGAFDILGEWFVINDKVQHYYDNPNYKEYLTLMNRWYKAGYLSKDFAALTEESKIYALFDSGRLGLYTQSVDNAYARAAKINNFTIESGPYPRKTANSKLHSAPATWPISTSDPYDTVVTSSCKNVKAAVQFLNYGYTEKGSMVFNYGVEGQSYKMVEGKPVFTDLMLNNPNGLTSSNVSYIYKIHLGSKLNAPDTKALPGVVKDPASLAFRTKWSDDSNVDNLYRLPPVDLTADEISQNAEIISDVSPYVSEMMLKFIIGAEPLSNFDKYLEQLKSMNFAKVKQNYQNAYERYMKK